MRAASKKQVVFLKRKKGLYLHTLKEFLDTMAQRYGRTDAYVWMDGERMVSRSFEDLRRDACAAAGFLAAHFGIGKHIALLGDMSYDWIVTWYGIILAGHVSVPLDSKLSPTEISERLAFADVSAVFLSRQHAFLKEDLAGCGDWEVLQLGDASGETAVHAEPERLQSPRRRCHRCLPPAHREMA